MYLSFVSDISTKIQNLTFMDTSCEKFCIPSLRIFSARRGLDGAVLWEDSGTLSQDGPTVFIRIAAAFIFWG